MLLRSGARGRVRRIRRRSTCSLRGLWLREQLHRACGQDRHAGADRTLPVGREQRRVIARRCHPLRLQRGEHRRVGGPDPEQRRRHPGVPVLAEVFRSHHLRVRNDVGFAYRARQHVR